MSRRIILALAAVAALASTALVVDSAFARSGGGHSMGRGGGGGGHSMGRGAGRGGHVSARTSHGKSVKQGGIRSGSKLSGSHKPGKAAGLHSHPKGKSGSAVGKLNSGPSKLSSASKGLGSGPGKQSAAAAGNKTAVIGLKAGPGSVTVHRDQMGPTNNTTPANQNAQNPNPPTNTGGVRPPQGNMGPILTAWGNSFKQNLKNSFDPGSVGTGFSACQIMALCAAGAPPGAFIVPLATAPFPGKQSSTFEAGINAFKPTDPTNPLSSPADQAMLNTLRSGPSVWNGLNITGTDAFKNSTLGGNK